MGLTSMAISLPSFIENALSSHGEKDEWSCDALADLRLEQDIAKQDRTHYPYSFSPLVFYAELEQKLMPTHTLATDIIPFANSIAQRVKAVLHEEVRASYPEASLRLTAAREDLLVRYMHIVAHQMTEAGCVLSTDPVSSLHEVMVKRKKSNKALPECELDCDTASDMVLHIVKIHDMPIAGAESVKHMYLCLRTGSIAFEMTEFGKGEYLLDHEKIRKGDHLKSDAAKRVHFYQAMTAQQLQWMIAGNLLYYMHNCVVLPVIHQQERWKVQRLENACIAGEICLEKLGPGFYIVANLAAAHGKASDVLECTEAYAQERAARHRERKKALEQTYAELICAPSEVK